MARKTRYYVGNVECRHGEYEFSCTIRFATTRNPKNFLKAQAKEWYGEPDRGCEDGEYYFNCGDVFAEAGDSKEISEAAFKELGSVITDMTNGK